MPNAVCHRFCSTCTANALTKEAVERLGDFKIGGKIIRTVKYADDLVLLAMVEKVLQGMIDKLIEIGGCYGMEMNTQKKNKSIENFKTSIPSKNYIPKTTRECGI